MFIAFIGKIRKETYDENLLKLKAVIDLREIINCDANLNLENAYKFKQSFFYNGKIEKEIEELNEIINNATSELSEFNDGNITQYKYEKEHLKEKIKQTKLAIEHIHERTKDYFKISINNALNRLYKIESYECTTSQQLQFGGSIDTKKVQDKSWTTIEDTFEGSKYKVSWISKGKLSKNFFSDLTLRLNNYQTLNSYEDYTRIDSKILKSQNKKLYSIFVKSSYSDTAQTFYNIELDQTTKLSKNQYVQFFEIFTSKGKQEKYLAYAHFNSLGITIFSCASSPIWDCSDNANFSVNYAKLTSSDSSLRAKAKLSSISENDPSRDFFKSINKESAKQLGLITDLKLLQNKISSTDSTNMSNILSKVGAIQSNKFYLDTFLQEN